MPEKPRGSETVGDAVRSLVALLGVIAVIVLAFTAMQPDEQLPDRVDYAGVLDGVRAEFPYPVVAPSPEPSGWRATSVEYASDSAGNRWRLGFLTDDEGFVGLRQSDGEIQSYLADELAEFTRDGSSRVAGSTWERWLESGDRPDRALVRVDDCVVTIVLGTVAYEVLEDFAAALRP
ncbi:MAG: DUF4245 domain-containing protein [Jiangellaceae bacterium]